jgi:ankyrin repeat protein
MARAAKRTKAGDDAGEARIDHEMLEAAYYGRFEAVKTAIRNGADVNAVHEQTGLTALHLAIGTNNLRLARYLIEEAGIIFGPDRSGRWPTLIAAQCRVSEEFGDYIVEHEGRIARK